MYYTLNAVLLVTCRTNCIFLFIDITRHPTFYIILSKTEYSVLKGLSSESCAQTGRFASITEHNVVLAT